ncbi:hypothetical protein ABVT39_005327 [Epinephelus coioides]
MAVDPITCSVPLALQLDQGKATSTIKVYASSISAFHNGYNGLPLGRRPQMPNEEDLSASASPTYDPVASPGLTASASNPSPDPCSEPSPSPGPPTVQKKKKKKKRNQEIDTVDAVLLQRLEEIRDENRGKQNIYSSLQLAMQLAMFLQELPPQDAKRLMKEIKQLMQCYEQT